MHKLCEKLTHGSINWPLISEHEVIELRWMYSDGFLVLRWKAGK